MVDFKSPKVIAAIVVGCIIILLVVVMSALYATGHLTSPSVGTKTSAPTLGPTSAPTLGPTSAPTLGPTSAPTLGPTSAPTLGPTSAPTSGPTSAPTLGPTSGPTSPPMFGALAVFSPDTNGNQWIESFDSMKSQDKCIFDTSNYNNPEAMSQANYAKLKKYIVENNLLPIDNPFQGVIDISITNSTGYNLPITLTLDLSKFNGVNPFKAGDQVYIYGVKGNTAANTPSGLGTGTYIYSTRANDSKLLANQVKLTNSYPCTYGDPPNCDYPETLNVYPIIGNGTYAGGGIIRKFPMQSYTTGYLDSFSFSFYTTSLNPPVEFMWPVQPMSASEAYAFYSSHYADYLNWLAKTLPVTCITSTSMIFGIGSSPYIDQYPEQDISKYVSGPASTSGGSGSGMLLNLTKIRLYGLDLLIPTVTSEGTGYQNGDVVNIVQGSNSNVTMTLDTITNCSKQIYSSDKSISLSSSITSSQFKGIINQALSLDPTINTIIVTSGNTFKNPENYNIPNITVAFLTSSTTETSYNYSSFGWNSGICDCSSPNDSVQNFFPNKVNHCVEQVIYTKVGSDAFDFASFSGVCNNPPTMC